MALTLAGVTKKSGSIIRSRRPRIPSQHRSQAALGWASGFGLVAQLVRARA